MTTEDFDPEPEDELASEARIKELIVEYKHNKPLTPAIVARMFWLFDSYFSNDGKDQRPMIELEWYLSRYDIEILTQLKELHDLKSKIKNNPLLKLLLK